MHHEGPSLVSRRACSRTLKGVFHNLEWPPLYLRTMKIAYKHTLLNPPKQPCLVHNPALNCPHLLLVSPQTHSSSSTKSWYIIPNPNLCCPQTHFAPSTSSFCIIRCPMVFRLLTHPALSPNPPYIASAPTFSTRSPKAFFFTTQKKKKQKTTVFYFFFFNLYFSSYTPYA